MNAAAQVTLALSSRDPVRLAQVELHTGYQSLTGSSTMVALSCVHDLQQSLLHVPERIRCVCQ